MVKQITKNQFNKLCKTKEPIYCADEYDAQGNHWTVWKFINVSGEYKRKEATK